MHPEPLTDYPTVSDGRMASDHRILYRHNSLIRLIPTSVLQYRNLFLDESLHDHLLIWKSLRKLLSIVSGVISEFCCKLAIKMYLQFDSLNEKLISPCYIQLISFWHFLQFIFIFIWSSQYKFYYMTTNFLKDQAV